MNSGIGQGAQHYRQVAVHSGVASAGPHRLIQMLLAGALEKLAVAKGNMERREVAEKGRNIGLAISIIDGLKGSLDHEKGGEIAQNLEGLYEYMGYTLVQANADNESAKLDEVSGLLLKIKGAWDTIPEEFQKIAMYSEEGKVL
ncbi:MAG: flagellar export chaperone FliS [Methylococcaceae bacterium]|nr:flagellar export chaperone FliS [Methylococcaceae bacterium]MCI0733313.1 flagellar export chaperone FliS [Methylococcaceae bacterium]